MAAERTDDVTDDAALGGRLRLLQPRSGHRFGHDAILLAAATVARSGDRAVDLGAGVGTAGLALAARVAGVAVVLVEIAPGLAALAAENAKRNDLADRVNVVTLDVTGPGRLFAAAGLAANSVDHVLMNPPFNEAARLMPSPEASRRSAHVAVEGSLTGWVKTAGRLLRRDGTVTLIHRADALGGILGTLASGFGAMAVLPIYPRPGRSAIRVIVRAVRGSRAPLSIAPGLLLHDENGRPAGAAEDILRNGAPLEGSG